MKIADWLDSYHTDRARFDAVTFGWAPEVAAELRNHVALILAELAEARVTGDLLAARLETLRGEQVAAPDLLALSGIGDALPGLIAAAVRDEGRLSEHFVTLAGAAVVRVGHLQGYHRCLARAAAVAEHVESLELQIRSLSASDGDAMLGVVADAAYRWPAWTFDSDVFDRAAAADGVLGKVERFMELGVLEQMLANPPDGSPSSAPATTYAPSGVPLAPPPPPPTKKG